MTSSQSLYCKSLTEHHQLLFFSTLTQGYIQLAFSATRLLVTAALAQHTDANRVSQKADERKTETGCRLPRFFHVPNLQLFDKRASFHLSPSSSTPNV